MSTSASVLGQKQTCTPSKKMSTPTTNFVVQSKVVEDLTTKKVWTHCAVGMQWNGKFCEGKSRAISYAEAMSVIDDYNREKFGGHSNWRLPTRDELLGIVEKGCYNPAINLDVFSYSPQSGFWSSTENPGFTSTRIEIVHFLNGLVYIANKNQNWRLRLIAD